MFAEYKGKPYKIIKNGKQWELLSKKSESVNDGFERDGKLYYRTVHDIAELDDLYNIDISVMYDTGLEKVPTEWRLPINKEYFTETSVKLVFVEGLLPGWNVEDKNVCSLYIDISKISKAWLVRHSKKNENIKEEISPLGLYKTYQQIVEV